MHLILEDDGKIIGYARILPPNLSYDEPSIGRIVLDKTYRGKGLGREIVQKCIDFIHNIMKIQKSGFQVRRICLIFIKVLDLLLPKAHILRIKYRIIKCF